MTIDAAIQQKSCQPLNGVDKTENTPTEIFILFFDLNASKTRATYSSLDSKLTNTSGQGGGFEVPASG